jgi:hypothetical protein
MARGQTIGQPRRSNGSAEARVLACYSGVMFAACLPFGPCLTSKLTFWFSCRDLKPFPWISEKCANRSSPPPSGVMNPKPFASLNHFTVPVAIFLNFPKKSRCSHISAIRPSVPFFLYHGKTTAGNQGRYALLLSVSRWQRICRAAVMAATRGCCRQCLSDPHADNWLTSSHALGPCALRSNPRACAQSKRSETCKPGSVVRRQLSPV